MDDEEEKREELEQEEIQSEDDDFDEQALKARKLAALSLRAKQLVNAAPAQPRKLKLAEPILVEEVVV